MAEFVRQDTGELRQGEIPASGSPTISFGRARNKPRQPPIDAEALAFRSTWICFGFGDPIALQSLSMNSKRIGSSPASSCRGSGWRGGRSSSGLSRNSVVTTPAIGGAA